MFVTGGRKAPKKNGSLKKYRSRGGALSSLSSAAPYNGVGTLPATGTPNMEQRPTTIPQSRQVGGMGYGYASGADASLFGGNYFPTSPNCTSMVDSSRGGNNFMSGGGRRRRTKRTGTKRTGTKRRGTKRSRGGRKSKKWRQKGCNMRGGVSVV
jgi:hypothetical protein